MAARVTINAVNAELKRRGKNATLVRGNGYFYFDGDALALYCSSVCRTRLNGRQYLNGPPIDVKWWADELDARERESVKERGF